MAFCKTFPPIEKLWGCPCCRYVFLKHKTRLEHGIIEAFERRELVFGDETPLDTVGQHPPRWVDNLEVKAHSDGSPQFRDNQGAGRQKKFPEAQPDHKARKHSPLAFVTNLRYLEKMSGTQGKIACPSETSRSAAFSAGS